MFSTIFAAGAAAVAAEGRLEANSVRQGICFVGEESLTQGRDVIVT
jgi:hypothetical protein